MKPLVVTLSLLLASLALAEEGADKEIAPTAGDCPLCKTPNRAALFAGVAPACPADCKKLCCTGTEVAYYLKGIACTRTAHGLRNIVEELEGVETVSIIAKTGLAVIRYDSKRYDPAQLRAALGERLFPVVAEQATFKIPTLTSEDGARVVEAALAKVEAVTRIETVCHRSAQTVVVFDPARTNRAKLAAAIDATGFNVVDKR